MSNGNPWLMSDDQRALEAARRISDLVVGAGWVRRRPFGNDLRAVEIASDARLVARALLHSHGEKPTE